MDVERIANELNDILIAFHNTLCNPNTPCKNCEIDKYRKKYNVLGSCNAIYLAIVLLGNTEDTAMFINKQYKIFKSAICKNDNFGFCFDKCYIRDLKEHAKELENRGSCFYIYLGTILLNDV